MALSRDAILAYRPKVQEIGPVPVYGDVCHIRHITVAARNEWAALRFEAFGGVQAVRDPDSASLDVGKMAAARVLLVAQSFCDANGELLLTTKEVGGMASEAVDFIADEAEKLNGLTDEAVEAVEGN